MKYPAALLTFMFVINICPQANAQYYEHGYANTTPYMAPGFSAPPRYVQQLGNMAGRRGYAAPRFRQYVPDWAYKAVRGGTAFGAATMYFTDPAQACAMDRYGNC